MPLEPFGPLWPFRAIRVFEVLGHSGHLDHWSVNISIHSILRVVTALKHFLTFYLNARCIYDPQRNILMSDLATLCASLNNYHNVFIDLNRQDHVAKLLLYGLNLLVLEECAYFNSVLFNIISNFISSTSRITQHYY